MKTKAILFTLFFLVSCGPAKESATIYQGKDGKDGSDGRNGTSCSVSEALSDENEVIGALISCGDGSSQIVLNGSDGQNGADGADGINGLPGNSCSISRESGKTFVTVTCGETSQVVFDGQDGLDGEDGTDGEDGATGAQGPAGINANGCTLTFIGNQGNKGNKYQITCGSTSAIFTDSTNPSNN
jgi:hypothetical protein